MTRDFSHIAADRQIVSERTVNAPAHLIFLAWTDPRILAKWWGPAGFTNTFLEHDLRVGGRWKFIMHGPDKGNYPNEVVFTDIDPPSLIAWYRISKPLFKVAATFEKVQDDKTRIIFRMIFDTDEERNKLINFVPEKNEENFDRLEVELQKLTGKF